MNAAPVVPLSLLAEPESIPATLPVRFRLRYVLGVIQGAELVFWVPAMKGAEEELRAAVAALDSIAAEAQAAPRSWLVERIEAEV